MAGETYKFRGATCQWGTLSMSAAGTVVDETMKKSGPKEPVENRFGAETGRVYYDELYAGTLTIVAAQSATLPEIGDTVEISFAGGVLAVFVDDVEDKGTHKGKRMFIITASGGANIDMTGSSQSGSSESGTSGTGGTQQGG